MTPGCVTPAQDEADPSVVAVIGSVFPIPPEAGTPRPFQLLKRIAAPAWQHEGFLNDFLLDWASQRVTHALISPQFPPLAAPDQMWFAVPIAQLNSPRDGNAIVVNSTPDAFRRAARDACQKMSRTMRQKEPKCISPPAVLIRVGDQPRFSLLPEKAADSIKHSTDLGDKQAVV